MAKTTATTPVAKEAAATPAAPSMMKAPVPTGKKHHEAAPGMCAGMGCKHKSERMTFCGEHFEQFKFGLVNKFGELVPDYEKKWEHYQAYKARMAGFRKAA